MTVYSAHCNESIDHGDATYILLSKIWTLARLYGWCTIVMMLPSKFASAAFVILQNVWRTKRNGWQSSKWQRLWQVQSHSCDSPSFGGGWWTNSIAIFQYVISYEINPFRESDRLFLMTFDIQRVNFGFYHFSLSSTAVQCTHAQLMMDAFALLPYLENRCHWFLCELSNFAVH